jgi:C-methyltransferase
MTTAQSTGRSTAATTAQSTSAHAGMRLRELVFGAACAAAVRAAAQLRLADALQDTPASTEELAAALKTEVRPLRRLLRTLSCYDIFAETGNDRWTHTEMSRLLREDSPNSLRYISLWCTEPWTWQVWPRLDEAVRSGRKVFPDVFGKEFFDYLHDGAAASAEVFDKAMTQSSKQSAEDFAAYVDLTGVSSVVDIGGGQGHVIASLLEKDPNLHGTLLDLPKVVANADPRLRPGGALANRAHLLPGDCRQEVPVRADLYIIKNILEWDDESTRLTLRNVIRVARPGARVIVVENLVDDSPSMRFTTAMDLLLLLNVGGAKHSKESLVNAMTAAGLELRDIQPINAYLHAFEANVPV